MKGIDNIVARIGEDAKLAAGQIAAENAAKAAEIEAEARQHADAEYERLAERGRAEAARRGERLRSSAELDSKKKLLAAKQELIDAAFARAVDKLCAVSGGEKISLLASLAAKAASGGEALIFNPADREECGAAVAAAANALLEKAGRPASLTLSEETRAIRGGVILSGRRIELNCSFESLVYSGKNSLTGGVADLLFG